MLQIWEECLNGEKNGKGKEYGYSGEIKFEGEYLYNAKRKGKEYNNKGKLEYEGEYLFGNKWIGKEYDENGKVICEYINGDKKIISQKFILRKYLNGNNKLIIYL